MKKIFLLIVICLLITSCSTYNKDFVKTTYDSIQVILPNHLDYIAKDATLSDTDKEIRKKACSELLLMVKEEYDRSIK